MLRILKPVLMALAVVAAAGAMAVPAGASATPSRPTGARAKASASGASPATAPPGAGVPARPTTTSPPPPPAPTTTPPPSTPPSPITPTAGTLALSLLGSFVVQRTPVTVPGRRVEVDGVVRPYVPGQWVTVHVLLGRRVIRRDRLRIQPSRSSTYGRITEGIAAPRAGTVVVEAVHARTPQMTAFAARQGYSVLDPSARFGSSGRFVELVQQRLRALHFYLPQTGRYDKGTGLAVDAYHRILRRGTSQLLDRRTLDALLGGRGQFRVRYPKHGRHAEGDLGRQLLALAVGPRVEMIFPISSGKPSTPTKLGTFRIYARADGYLRDGMFYSSFFTGGYAIHGYNPAPDYPASHGCMRLPLSDAISAYRWLDYNDIVDVYH